MYFFAQSTRFFSIIYILLRESSFLKIRFSSFILMIFNFGFETHFLIRLQITDGVHLIQLWLSDEVLLDCEFTINRRSIDLLLKEFNQRIINLNNNLNTNHTILRYFYYLIIYDNILQVLKIVFNLVMIIVVKTKHYHQNYLI